MPEGVVRMRSYGVSISDSFDVVVNLGPYTQDEAENLKTQLEQASDTPSIKFDVIRGFKGRPIPVEDMEVVVEE